MDMAYCSVDEKENNSGEIEIELMKVKAMQQPAGSLGALSKGFQLMRTN